MTTWHRCQVTGASVQMLDGLKTAPVPVAAPALYRRHLEPEKAPAAR